MRTTTTVQVLFTPGCATSGPTLRLLRKVIAEEDWQTAITVRIVNSVDDAIRYRFTGSPTILVDGVDIEGPSVQRDGYRFRCRLYYGDTGLSRIPDPNLIRSALYTHPGKRRPGLATPTAAAGLMVTKRSSSSSGVLPAST